MVWTRFALILLLILNGLALAAIAGWFGAPASVGEPERVANQLHPERVRFIGEQAPSASAAVSAAPAATADNTTAANEAPAPSAPPAEPPPASTLACASWSGLSAEEAERLAARIAEAGLTVRRHSGEAPASWWVRLPPQGSRDQAERKVRELKALGVTDYFIVQDAGPNQFAISLGLFKSEAAAHQQLAQLRSRGVRTAGVAPRLAVTQAVDVIATEEQLRRVATGLPAANATCTP